MKALQETTRHLTVILSLMFAVFQVLDIYNPLMNFVNNDISHVLLAALCVMGLTNVFLDWRLDPAAKRMPVMARSEGGGEHE